MPSIVRNLVILAAVDGLVVKPTSARNHQERQCLSIKYKTPRIVDVVQDVEYQGKDHSKTESIEAHGILGLLNAASSSFLISITRRQQVAQIQGKPIYVITGVTFIPLSSQADAANAIQHAKQFQTSTKTLCDANDGEASGGKTLAQQNATTEESDSDTSSLSDIATSGNGIGTQAGQKTSVAEDVLKNKGLYGRFADRWFSRKGWSTEAMAGLGMRGSPSSKGAGLSLESEDPGEDSGGMRQELDVKEETSDVTRANIAEKNIIMALLPKVLRRARMMLASGNFYFSYDYDITRNIAEQESKQPDVPMYKRVDSLFFWNQHLARPLIEQAHDAFVLPIMQGFVGQKEFVLEESQKSETGVEGADAISCTTTPKSQKRSFLLTLISRRSIKRPGLRYLRRGVDEEGHTANFVETEQILSDSSWDKSRNIYSFRQVRGSIPLFFTQSPYTFKPLPLLQYSAETNRKALGKHFANLQRRYGHIQVVQLLDKHGVEIGIGEEYEKQINAINNDAASSDKVFFEWFDFHYETRGLKFENIGKLIQKLTPRISSFGYTVVNDNVVTATQTGTIRTNCMDSLDRTGNAQSAFGEALLESQLQSEGLTVDFSSPETTAWFNALWADNGDAISRQYASTAALKGDFTRTRRRAYAGLLNDFSLTLSRYLHNTLSDYLTQATIDHLLNSVPSALTFFAASLANPDPSPISLPFLRSSAIEACTRHAVPPSSGEQIVDAWTLQTPLSQSTSSMGPFEESVLLLTDKALYTCRFDWNTELVGEITRIQLQAITGIQWGTYVTNTLDEMQADEERNVGMLIRYRECGSPATLSPLELSEAETEAEAKSEGEQSTHKRASSLFATLLSRNASRPATEPVTDVSTPSTPEPTSAQTKTMTFKVLSSMALSGAAAPSEKETLFEMMEAIARTAQGMDTKREDVLIEEGAIVSLEEARRRTGLLDKFGFGVRKLVWG